MRGVLPKALLSASPNGAPNSGMPERYMRTWIVGLFAPDDFAGPALKPVTGEDFCHPEKADCNYLISGARRCHFFPRVARPHKSQKAAITAALERNFKGVPKPGMQAAFSPTTECNLATRAVRELGGT